MALVDKSVSTGGGMKRSTFHLQSTEYSKAKYPDVLTINEGEMTVNEEDGYNSNNSNVRKSFRKSCTHLQLLPTPINEDSNNDELIESDMDLDTLNGIINTSKVQICLSPCRGVNRSENNEVESQRNLDNDDDMIKVCVFILNILILYCIKGELTKKIVSYFCGSH